MKPITPFRSDWGATHSLSINAGLDQEMPGSDHMGNAAIKAKVNSGDVKQDKVDDAALRVLTPMFAMGVFDKPNNNTQENNVTSLANNKLARDLAAQSIVLLKNDGNLFPLKSSGPIKLALIGDQAKSPTVHGGGSGTVYAQRESNSQSPYPARPAC